jgi:tripeptidyl-peptidase-1
MFKKCFLISSLIIGSCFVESLDYVIALKQKNINIIKKLVLEEVSNISSPNYGKYYTSTQINNIVKPDRIDKLPLLNWLTYHQIRYKDYGDALVCNSDHKVVNRLFKTKIVKNNNKYYYLTDTYLIPKRFSKIIVFIEGLVRNKYKDKARFGRVHKVDDGYVSREVMQNLYNLTDGDNNSSKSLANISSCSVEYQDNAGFSEADLINNQLLNNETTNKIAKRNIVGINQGLDVESQLDVQLMSQVAEGIELWFWDDPNWLYSFAVRFLNTKRVPDVLSMSWGWAEREQCSIITCTNETSRQYVDRVNNEYAKLALRGITIVVASGDAGAPGRTNEVCNSLSSVNPVFPGSSPWVTSVGATYVVDKSYNLYGKTPLCQKYQCAAGSYELPTNFNTVGWTGGGGFAIFDSATRPKWQASQVNKYLSSNVNLPTVFNRKGRGYPDISAVGHNCPVVDSNEIEGVDGTSCSTPVIAGFISLINNFMISNNRSKVGFFNPLLYLMYQNDSSLFNDIKSGNNYCTEMMCCPSKTNKRNITGSDWGYVAREGWDPVTGLGTPNMGRIFNWLRNNLINNKI